MAEKYCEQFNRFYAALQAKEEFSFNCEKCPIKKECYEFTDNLTIAEAENAPCCEELLLNYILKGEKPC